MLRPYLEKKENELAELNQRLDKHRGEMITFEEHRRQMQIMRRQNEEQRDLLRAVEEELSYHKQLNENAVTHHEKLSEEIQPKKELIRVLKSLLERQEFTDCILVNNNQRYLAHKCILAIRSDALRRLLEGGHVVGHTHRENTEESSNVKPKSKKEEKENHSQTTMNNTSNKAINHLITIEVNEIEPDIMPFVMNYIYTADAENKINDRNVKDIMKAADWLEIQDLRKCCLAFMETKLNRNTVIPVLIEAFLFNNEKLKTKCMNFILDENIDFVKTHQWNTFKNENPKLALELYERFVQETGGAGGGGTTRSSRTTNPPVYVNAHSQSHAKHKINEGNGERGSHTHTNADKSSPKSNKKSVRASIDRMHKS
jgi:hypothetical protein